MLGGVRMSAPKRGREEGEKPFWISFSDLMSALMVLFLVAMSVALLDSKGQPARSWGFVNAWPVSWQVEAFNASKNEVAIEKLEFSYQYLSRES